MKCNHRLRRSFIVFKYAHSSQVALLDNSCSPRAHSRLARRRHGLLCTSTHLLLYSTTGHYWARILSSSPRDATADGSANTHRPGSHSIWDRCRLGWPPLRNPFGSFTFLPPMRRAISRLYRPLTIGSNAGGHLKPPQTGGTRARAE